MVVDMTKVCAACIGEDYLKRRIIKSGKVTRCDYCHSEVNPTVEIENLAARVHSVLQKHFYMTSPEPEGIDLLAAREGYWEQPGEPVTNVIMNLVYSSEEIAEAMLEYLSSQYDPCGKDALTNPSPYAGDSQYEERPIDTYEFQESWSTFRKEILANSRFFNQTARGMLEHLFHGIEQLTTRDGQPVVRVLRESDCIYRARVAKTDDELTKILAGAPQSLGPPPGIHASGGRMNAEGISVLYGATDAETCIAEVRAPVGSMVVICNFKPVRELRVLDLTLLEKVFLQGSLFDSEHTKSMSRVHFLKRVVDELSQPVLPGAEIREYLPTQVVAEYLGSHSEMKLDGVMFASSQTTPLDSQKQSGDKNPSGKNVVLFSRASILERYSLPTGSTIDVQRYHGDPDDPEHSIVIWENVPNELEQNNGHNLEPDRHGWPDFMLPPEPVANKIDASIRLDMESIEVRRIEGISYRTFPFDVIRHRTKNEKSEF